jgi:hypothetical protein
MPPMYGSQGVYPLDMPLSHGETYATYDSAAACEDDKTRWVIIVQGNETLMKLRALSEALKLQAETRATDSHAAEATLLQWMRTMHNWFNTDDLNRNIGRRLLLSSCVSTADPRLVPRGR